MFTEPFPDTPLEKSLPLSDRLVTCLMMVPIADSEYEFAKARGWEALGQVLEDHDVDVWDLERRPLV